MHTEPLRDCRPIGIMSLAERERSQVVILLALAAVWAAPRWLCGQKIPSPPPALNLILDSVERTEQENPALTHSYTVTRQYKMFRGDDRAPSSEVTARISFTPPETKAFEIVESHGNPRGEKIVRALLEQEIAAAKQGHQGDISRLNYDFVFLREQNFGVVPEYVLHIVPKRKEKGLLVGDIWVDAKTYHIRQIVGVPLKSPSLWIKDPHITIQFAAVRGMWIPVSVDALATVRFLGLYTLTGLDVGPEIPISVTPGTSNSLPVPATKLVNDPGKLRR
jgi:hypothetical protein